MKISKKTLLILLVVILLMGAALLAYFFNKQKDAALVVSNPADNSKPVFIQEFMTAEEKKELSMSEDLRVQVIKRDASGEPMTFKIIKSEADIITSDSIPSIRPEK